MDRIIKFCKGHLLAFLTVMLASFMGFYFSRILPSPDVKPKVVHDIIYVQQPLPDSLLDSIAKNVSEINNKLTPKKVYLRKRPAVVDTIRIDAQVRVEK